MFRLLPLLLLTSLCTCACAQNAFPVPINGIVASKTAATTHSEPTPSQKDILWKKEVYRIIDVGEKMNHHFNSAEQPLINVLLEAADSNRIQLYSPTDDNFSTRLSVDERLNINGGVDTIMDYSMCMSVTYEAIPRQLNPNRIRRYHLREAWYVDKNSSKMKVRLLGIAPMIEEIDENGNVLSERSLFWIYYPAARKALAQERVFLPNDAASRTWADVLDSRQFASYTVEGLRPE